MSEIITTSEALFEVAKLKSENAALREALAHCVADEKYPLSYASLALELEHCRAALRPFAEKLSAMDAHAKKMGCPPMSDREHMAMPVGDFRRSASVLEKKCNETAP
jgi:hypothetical protein